MPYILQDRRDDFTELMDTFRRLTNEDSAFEPGDLNYIFTKFIHIVIAAREKNYAFLNALIGVLECCKLELYRGVIADYENQKIKENGGVV